MLATLERADALIIRPPFAEAAKAGTPVDMISWTIRALAGAGQTGYESTPRKSINFGSAGFIRRNFTMYQPQIFREKRLDVLHAMTRLHPFATLISIQDGEKCADHLPLMVHSELSRYGTICGHIAKANPLWRSSGDSIDAVAIFQGPQAYVTPSWYPSKKEHGKAVPTWNYVVVHARGKLKLVDDQDWLLDHLVEMTEKQEYHRPVPWEVSDAPEDYLARQLKGIVGLELEIASIDGKWKVSQNKDAKDRAGVRRGLPLEANPDADAMAELVANGGE